MSTLGALALASGLLLLLGLFTPVAAFAVALGSAVMAWSRGATVVYLD